MKKNRGFTLLEILIVVVIVGILASLAIPQYEKSVENSRGAEAIANLSILRGSELRHFGEYDEFVSFDELDVENPDPGKYFTYELISPNPSTGEFTIRANRSGGMYINNYMDIDQDGTFTGTWPFLP